MLTSVMRAYHISGIPDQLWTWEEKGTVTITYAGQQMGGVLAEIRLGCQAEGDR